MICREDRVERLLSNLAVHEVDLVLADTPALTVVAIATQARATMFGPAVS